MPGERPLISQVGKNQTAWQRLFLWHFRLFSLCPKACYISFPAQHADVAIYYQTRNFARNGSRVFNTLVGSGVKPRHIPFCVLLHPLALTSYQYFRCGTVSYIQQRSISRFQKNGMKKAGSINQPAFERVKINYTNSIMTISAASPRRGPSL